MAIITITRNMGFSGYTYTNDIYIDNWRATGRYGNRLVLIAGDLSTYIINNITTKYFYKLVGTDEKIFKKGFTLSVNLPCQKCNGGGYIDWISEVMPTKKQHIIVDYRKGNNIFYKAKGPFPHTDLYDCTPLYFSTAYISEQYKLCNKCFGTGLEEIKTFLKGGYKKIIV